MTTSYTLLHTARPTVDPVHASMKTRIVKFDGGKLRRITRDQGVVTIECVKSGRVVEVPWASCVDGVVERNVLKQAYPRIDDGAEVAEPEPEAPAKKRGRK